MTDTERLDRLEAALLKLTDPKPSILRQCWNWCKPYIIPFLLGVLVGILATAVCGLPSAVFPPTLERQAAVGGAAIPFPNESPLPSPSNSLPGDSITESTASSSTNISELPLPPSLQADNGQTNSQRLFHRPLVRRR